ncbi:MAG: gliding motility-associated C-terminal domain-containing protein [Bacteroidota bacterium]
MAALPLAETAAYCSAAGEYSNANARKASWFVFTATAFDVNITVSGAGAGGTLIAPVIQLYSDCAGTDLVGTAMSGNNVTTFYKGGLIIGNHYYLKITGEAKATGTFKLCLNNYNPVLQAGQDCGTASFLCSTQTISQSNVTGAGLDNNEAKGTCLSADGQATESNSVWYKWQAANNGTLVFTITPNSVHDDIDWVLFDLGPTGDCANVIPANAIRCKAGYGVDNVDCPQDSIYYKTGLDFHEIDLSEPPGCGKGQNGKLKFVDAVAGHIYGLLINNFSSGNNGFTLSFTDQKGVAGTVEFVGPKPDFTYSASSDCGASPEFTFTNLSSNYSSLNWSFGDGASLQNMNGPGPHVVSYTTPGLKTVTLSATGEGGCTVTVAKQLAVGIKPPLPSISIDKTVFCVNDTVKLVANSIAGLTYSWTGPNGFVADSTVAVVVVKGNSVAGTYKLVTNSFGCSSDTAYLDVPEPQVTPLAAFHTNPVLVNAQYGPVTVQFINDTFNADGFLWDFGDGTTSNLENPTHVYNRKGAFDVTLTASRNSGCSVSAVKSSVVVIQNNSYVFIPNTFTPNGDGINDLFNVTITNLKSYHIRIFDRWGQQLFEARDILRSWDGTYNGKRVAFGVYFYVVDAVSSDGEGVKRSGWVTVIH